MKKIYTAVAALGFVASCVGMKRQMIKPQKAPEEKISWLMKKPIAHRGLHNNEKENPENTLAAFQMAAKEGYPIELDVRLTKDKKVVVCHDESLERLMGLDWKIQNVTFDDIKEECILNSKERMPLFQEVLSQVDGKVPLLVELKTPGRAGVLEKQVYGMLKGYKGDYAVQSFNPLSLKWFRDHGPEVVRGQLSGNFRKDGLRAANIALPLYQKLLLKNLLVNFLSKPNFIAYELEGTLHARLIKMRRLGVPLLLWTVRKRSDYLEVKDLCDNVITDDVAYVEGWEREYK